MEHAREGQKHCPRCGSAGVGWASGLPQLWSIYECRECGYRGSLVVENPKLAQKIRKRWLRGLAENSGKTEDDFASL